MYFPTSAINHDNFESPYLMPSNVLVFFLFKMLNLTLLANLSGIIPILQVAKEKPGGVK